MSEQTGVTTTTEETTTQEQENTFQAITSQEDLDKVIQARIARERAKFADYDALKAKAAKADDLEAANMSELEKAQKAAADAEHARAELEKKVNAFEHRAQVEEWAREIVKGSQIPASALRGDSEEELQAHFEQLKSLIPEKPFFNIPGNTESQSSRGGEKETFIANLFGKD